MSAEAQAARDPLPGAALRGVDLRIAGRDILTAVDLTVRPGELVALIGPNGAGKSTALAVLAGDATPDAGQATIADRPAHRIRVSDLGRLRSVLLQQKGVSFSYPVRDVVRLGRMPWQAGAGRGRRILSAIEPGSPTRSAEQNLPDDDAIVADALARTDTAHLADRDVTTLSGGELARVSLARVLAQRCPIVLLDEPTDALDIAHQEQVLTLARGLATDGIAVVAVLHDLGLAAAYADRVVLLAEGRVVADGSPREVMTGERLSRVYGHPVETLDHPRTGALLVLPIRG
ncbi:heme ABC transporter ATP-binding protein [Leifsonia poae]|uniref:heme ABC transporter ATP-binding protein n=1 Tax=Leifsonia poae TaxID=110933 RepID=UPI001CBAC9B6|nr:heme ABC transporter ATP-binding protein [Leifsonia poae]